MSTSASEEAQQAFAAAKEDDVVAWPKVQAYAEAHGLLDPKSVLFKNLRQFKIAREQIEAIYDEHFTGAVRDIPWRGEDLGDDRRQCALNGLDLESARHLGALVNPTRAEAGYDRKAHLGKKRSQGADIGGLVSRVLGHMKAHLLDAGVQDAGMDAVARQRLEPFRPDVSQHRSWSWRTATTTTARSSGRARRTASCGA